MIETGMRTPPADTSLAVTEQYTEAYNLNVKIHTSMQAIQQNLYDMCSALKRMRDGKLYKELGYQNFEEYCENEAGIKRAHAYRFITILEKLPPDFVSSMRQIGATKLSLLTALTDDQREEIAESVDLSAVTVKQLQQEIYQIREKSLSDEQARIRQLQEKQERITELTAERDRERKRAEDAKEAQETTRQTLKGMLDKHIEHERALEAQIKEMESKPQDVAVVDRTEEIEQLKAKIESLQTKLTEKADTQLALGVEPIYQNDTKAVFKPYLTAAVDSMNRLIAFIEQNTSDSNLDFFIEKAETALKIVSDRIETMKGA